MVQKLTVSLENPPYFNLAFVQCDNVKYACSVLDGLSKLLRLSLADFHFASFLNQ